MTHSGSGANDRELLDTPAPPIELHLSTNHARGRSQFVNGNITTNLVSTPPR